MVRPVSYAATPALSTWMLSVHVPVCGGCRWGGGVMRESVRVVVCR